MFKEVASRHYRNPQSLEGASLLCTKGGENNYVVAAYFGSEGGSPAMLDRGGVVAARKYWATFEQAIKNRGFVRDN